MSVFRINKTNNFTVMSNYHFKEKKMSLKAKGLLSLMLSLPDDWDYSISGLVKLSKDGKDSVMTALAELEKFGYLTRTQLTNEKGQFSGVAYNIFEKPQSDSAVSEKQNSANQTSENRISENPPQLNTNSINHLKNKSIKELSTKDSSLISDEIYDILIAEIEDDELRDLYMDYVLMRSENSPLTPKGLKMLIARGYRLSEFNPGVHKSIVETAIINNWLNIYAPKSEEKLSRNSKLEEHGKILFGDQISSREENALERLLGMFKSVPFSVCRPFVQLAQKHLKIFKNFCLNFLARVDNQ